MGKTHKFLCVKAMSRQLEVREGKQLQGGREIAVRGCSANSWSQENVCVRPNRPEPVREEKTYKIVLREEKTDKIVLREENSSVFVRG